jgi:catechol 2,3-dioxygenase-like lactoylglutathione lyase family enzyme
VAFLVVIHIDGYQYGLIVCFQPNINMEGIVSRLQLALSVADLKESVDFHIKVFGVEPHKIREGYANFEISELPLKLVLIEVGAEARGHGPAGALNHLGVEELTAESYSHTRARIDATGLVDLEEADTTCCYAAQD